MASASKTVSLFCPEDTYFRKQWHESVDTDSAETHVVDEIAISLHVETTGSSVCAGQAGIRPAAAMVELGAVALRPSDPDKPLAVFEGFMGLPKNCAWDAQHRADIWDSHSPMKEKIKRIESGTWDERATMTAFVSWVARVCAVFAANDSARIVFYCRTPETTVKWIDFYLSRYTVHPYGCLGGFFGYHTHIVGTESHALGIARHSGSACVASNKKGMWHSAENEASLAVGLTGYTAHEGHVFFNAAHEAFENVRLHVYILNTAILSA